MITGFNVIIRKVLGVKRRKAFSSDYVNDLHKRGDVFFRVVMVIAGMVVLIAMPQSPIILFWVTTIILALNEIFRAIMEWKYKKETNDYLFTIFQILFILTVAYVAIESKGFGLFAF